MRKLLFILSSLFFSTIVLSQDPTVGLFLNENASFNGYTLFSPNRSNTTYLIDNCGRVVNSWTSQYLPGSAVYLQEDGHLLRTCKVTSAYFSGGGLGGRVERYDWDGNLVWHFDFHGENFHSHHDVEMLPNGNILLIVWDAYDSLAAKNAGRDYNNLQEVFWSEKIVELEPVGSDQANIVWEWKAWDHLVQDFDAQKDNFGVVGDHPELLNLNYSASSGPEANKDWLHCNSVDYNPDLDQIIISSRNLSEVWIIDHSTTTLEASGHTGGIYGKGGDILYRYGNPEAYDRGTIEDRMLFFQHDANWVKEYKADLGKLIVFSNQPAPNTSEVVIFDPPMDNAGFYKDPGTLAYGPDFFDWKYTSTDIFSGGQSGVERLPNGNTLISSGAKGLIIEVDMDKKLLWKYVNPVGIDGPVNQGENPIQNIIFKSRRYSPEYVGFNGLTLIPGDPIELNPYPSSCFVSNDSIINLDITVYLEGAFEEDNMHNSLYDQGLLPKIQPYKSEPWLYPGSELVKEIPNQDIVDWVLVEIRDAVEAELALPETIISRQVAFLKKDGKIVDLDGNSLIQFYNSFTEDLYVVIWHRNHLQVMSSMAFKVINDTYNYNFSNGETGAFGDNAGHKLIAPGIWGMMSGDGNMDGQITTSDKYPLWNENAGLSGYLQGDYNLDGNINNIDKNEFLLPNLDESSQIPD